MLDCNSPLGQEFMREQYKTQRMLESMGYTVINTSGDDNYQDVILAKKADDRLVIHALAEIKSRKMAGNKVVTVDFLRENGGYLITYNKLKYGAMAAGIYHVPFFVIVRLIECDTILIWQITDQNGNYLEKIKTEETVTRANVNGGQARRLNAFLSMDSKYLTVL
jgi:hypothetical protein